MTQTSPSHLTVLLAMGLGASLTYALSVTDAVGYPAGATISKGENPVFRGIRGPQTQNTWKSQCIFARD